MIYLDSPKLGTTFHPGHSIANFQQGFEGSVTHTWMSILKRLDNKDFAVVDGGMNTGFYTTLTAVMGYQVHSLDIQLDCFDVARRLLQENGVLQLVHFYHLGLWNASSSFVDVQEGCDPGRTILDHSSLEELKEQQTAPIWPRQTHRVPLVSLGDFLNVNVLPRPVAILKLDIEGGETAALQGLSHRHWQHIQNIILECAQERQIRLGFHPNQFKTELQKLQQHGNFTPYMLFQPRLEPDMWWNDTHLSRSGLQITNVHPILGTSTMAGQVDNSNVMMWRVVDWDLLLKGYCFRACNLLFTKMALTHSSS